MAQETIKLNVLYASADHLRQRMETVVTQYFARLLLALEHLAIKQGDTESLRALAEVMIANMDGTSAETFFNKNPQLKDIEVSIPDGALEFSTLVRSILYLAGAEIVPAEVAAPTETGPDFSAWPALGKFLKNNSEPGSDGKRYIQSAKVTGIIGGDRDLSARYSCLNYYLHDCIKYTPQGIGVQGASNTKWYEIQDCFSKLQTLKNTTKIELTIER